MIPALSPENLTELVKNAIQNSSEHKVNNHNGPYMIGILFAHPKDPLAKSEIIPKLSQYHFASGKDVFFFCAGYSAYGPSEGKKEVANIDGIPWEFSERSFSEFCKFVSKETKWKFSGESSLLLFDSYVNGEGLFELYTKTALSLDLSQMIRDKAIDSVSRLFHDIFNFKQSKPAHGVDRLSDVFGFLKGKQHILKKFGQFFHETKHFAIQDISKTK